MKEDERNRWRQANELLRDALTVESNRRATFVAESCKDDDVLLSMVNDLLASHERAGDFLEAPVSLEPESEYALTRERLGPYRILRELGRGGMATVYLAVRNLDGFEQRVALKILHDSDPGSKLMRRFEEERQLLAGLDHPGIARFLDAGRLEGGAPFLAMEYIEGEPIDTYCRRESLSLEARVSLLKKVCEVVHFAHTNLVVHRDLKPDNVLVTEDGTPKLIDFGIAKHLKPELSFASVDVTVTLDRALTPKYASPEQLLGRRITTASDIYSLGVVGFRILTGQLPYGAEDQSLSHLVAAISRGEVTKPSVAATWDRAPSQSADTATAGNIPPKQLRGDLDSIVMKSLANHPRDRYASAAEVADDYQRFLDKRPVLARKTSLGYRTIRLLRRRPWRSAAVALAGLSMLASMVVVALSSAQTRKERDRAARITEFVTDMFEISDPYESGSEGPHHLQSILRLGAARMTAGLASDRAFKADLQLVLGRITSRLGFYSDAEELLMQSLALRRSDAANAKVLAEVLFELGVLKHSQGQFDRAYDYLVEGLELTSSFPDDSALLALSIKSKLSRVQLERGALAESTTLADEALAACRLREHDAPVEVARVVNEVALARQGSGDFRAAEALHRHALALRQGALGSAHPEIANSRNNLAIALLYQGRYAASAEAFSQALASFQEIFGSRHPEVAVGHTNVATSLYLSGQVAEAEVEYRIALEQHESLIGTQHPVYATSATNYACLLRDSGRFGEAEELLLSALATRRLLYGTDEPHPEFGESHDHLGRLHLLRGELAHAEREIQTGLAQRLASLPSNHPDIGKSRKNLALLFAEKGELAAARREIVEALSLLEAAVAPSDWRLDEMRSILGWTRWHLGDESGRELMERSHRNLLEKKGPQSLETREAAQRIVSLDTVQLL